MLAAGSPNKTPTSSSSMQEMMFSFPAEKLTENVTLVQIPSGAQRRRRASMQDALDHTKINASLYSMERPVRIRTKPTISSSFRIKQGVWIIDDNLWYIQALSPQWLPGANCENTFWKTGHGLGLLLPYNPVGALRQFVIYWYMSSLRVTLILTTNKGYKDIVNLREPFCESRNNVDEIRTT